MAKIRELSLGEALPSTVVHVAGHPYLLHTESEATVHPLSGDALVPATFVDFDGPEGYLDDVIAGADFARDDVWNEGFLKAVIHKHGKKITSSTHISSKILHSMHQLPDGHGPALPTGPCVILPSGNIHRVYRLYADENNAFVRGVLPNTASTFRWLEVSDMIPVPSRIYAREPTTERPLAGLRFGVKDVIDVAGLETGNGSKCFRELYPPKVSTAPFISQLITAGAVMVGKMRCCQWCDGQDPLERLEEVTPTNPRGDGFQKPSASSSGSAAGCASYPWLDFTIGTDTGGSIRHPAGVNGLYGIRPTVGCLDSAGLLCTRYMDTPGVFARSAAVAEIVTKAAMKAPSLLSPQELPGQSRAESSDPSNNFEPVKKTRRFKLLYAVEPPSEEPSKTPKFFSSAGNGPEAQTPAGKLMRNFIEKLETHLGCAGQETCLYDLWKKQHPPGTPESLVEATGTIYQNIVYPTLYHQTIKPFIHDFKAVHGENARPFIESTTKARLDYGARVSGEEQMDAMAAFESYAAWVNDILLVCSSDDDETHITEENEIPLLIYPQSWGVPQYRDEVAKSEDGKLFWSGFSVYSISYCSGCPDFTIPVGEVEFTSKFTGLKGYLPVAVSLLGPRGMDLEMLRLIRGLEEKGVFRELQCGSRLFYG
ncbi:amidase signature domain-containing protein, partial [Pseudomassariella vexata]